MPSANLLERRSELDRIKRASDLGDQTEMHGKRDRIETEEPLTAAERADPICDGHSANNLTSRGKCLPCDPQPRPPHRYARDRWRSPRYRHAPAPGGRPPTH